MLNELVIPAPVLFPPMETHQQWNIWTQFKSLVPNKSIGQISSYSLLAFNIQQEVKLVNQIHLQ